VDNAGTRRFDYVIDKSSYGTLRLVRDRGRILVTADRFIFAAYDPATDMIIRYNDLPFTIWDGRGEVLDARRFADGAAHMRQDFPHRTEGKTTTATPAPTK
jgi:hypothetical protein